MELLRPPRLRRGDTIAVVTPSAPIRLSPSPDPPAEFERGIGVLRELGFEVVVAEHALGDGAYEAASPQQRADDINAMFGNRQVRAIVASHGGYNANALLPLLDWEAIRADPKILLGFSDVSTLLLAIHARTGLVTFHGNTVIWNLGLELTDYERGELLDRLVEGKIGTVNQYSEWRTVRNGPAVEGPLLGEALTLRRLLGTQWLPDVEGAVLFMETWGPMGGIDQTLHQLRQAGIFDACAGVLVGYTPPNDDGLRIEDLLVRVTADLDFPILQTDDFGHGCPNTVLPVGVRARLDPGSRRLELLEPAVT
jgi:muramoyltetrapeptide carboxypeptidase